MSRFILRRLLGMVPFMALVSITCFGLIKLPPGDFATNYAASLAAGGETVSQATLLSMREQYGLDRPFLVQYWRWIDGVAHGNFGYSFQWQQPVSTLIWGRMGLTLLLSLAALLFTWAIAFPIGVYSAVHKYSVFDYVFTFLGMLGLAVPGFLLGLVLMYIGIAYFGEDLGGLFSHHYLNAPWSLGRVADLLRHIWVPMVILGTSGAASLIRVMRANLLDQLHQPYVETARAKGLSEFTLLLRYPIRIALNPFVSTLGWVLPNLVSGSVIISIVLNLQTAGPLLLQALLSQDQYLAGAFLLLLCLLTVIGTLVSDILLALLDPRIRMQ
ncbi:MAG: ABC transporter permease [Rhodospirillales bacterium]|nr:ABC transporter permease [Rhodospirillales bacterium]MDE2197429.1 ABC transporter permease [Rhodospirillales bacterium]MDE2574419.1 ABC transporter permease [Rhodospirillales bacterium]